MLLNASPNPDQPKGKMIKKTSSDFLSICEMMMINCDSPQMYRAFVSQISSWNRTSCLRQVMPQYMTTDNRLQPIYFRRHFYDSENWESESVEAIVGLL